MRSNDLTASVDACCAARSSSLAAASSSSSFSSIWSQEPRLAFRAAAVELAPQLLDGELQMRDERFACSSDPPARWPPRPVPRRARPPPRCGPRARRGSSHGRWQDRREAIRKRRSPGDGITPTAGKPESSSDRGRTPSCLGMTPVDPGQKVAELGRRDRHRAVGGARPQEAAPFQPLREQACALAVMPDHLQQVAAAAAKAEQVAAQGIAAAAPPEPAATGSQSPFA